MKPLDIRSVEKKLIKATAEKSYESLLEVMDELSDRVSQAINPMSELSAGVVIAVLTNHVNHLRGNCSKESVNMADALIKCVGSVGIQIPDKSRPPEL